MSDRDFIENVRDRPGIYGLGGSYGDAVMFLIGFNEARSGGLLRGFTEWLVVRRGECISFGWQALVLDEALPHTEGWGRGKLSNTDAQQEKQAVQLLLSLLHEFLTVRDDVMALANMYGKYHALHSPPPSETT
ncbi:hypothetical protein ACJBCE_29625 [Streptomyces sp. NBUL23]|uniref:hypothetical protein n=1 Tax=Streptomyces TaxID=1883 RepID=UPI00366228B3